MPVVYRLAREQELARAEELVVGSINDLTERHGFGRMASLRPPHFQLFSLKDDPDGLWVAEDGDQILGFALSWVCGDLWFLAELFVAPGQQGRGIGNELLKRTMDHARHAKSSNKALITFTFNTVSQALYVRHGLLPRLPIYGVKIARDVLASRLQGAQFRCTPIQDTASHLRDLARIDAQVLGISREKHHRYLINSRLTNGTLLYAEDDCVGYAYVSPDGHIGPLAAAPSRVFGPAFRIALNLALANDTPQISAFLPGTSDALKIAMDLGMRITFPMVLMSASEFGDWAQYLPRNPGFM